jgi:hypothetical protein
LTVASAGPVAFVWYDFFSFGVFSLDEAMFNEVYELDLVEFRLLSAEGFRCNKIDRAGFGQAVREKDR